MQFDSDLVLSMSLNWLKSNPDFRIKLKCKLKHRHTTTIPVAVNQTSLNQTFLNSRPSKAPISKSLKRSLISQRLPSNYSRINLCRLKDDSSMRTGRKRVSLPKIVFCQRASLKMLNSWHPLIWKSAPNRKSLTLTRKARSSSPLSSGIRSLKLLKVWFQWNFHK